jgi:hypothetical protein
MSKVFKGLDYQGRQLEAAEAATDIGAEPSDPHNWLTPGMFWVAYVIAIICVLMFGTFCNDLPARTVARRCDGTARRPYPLAARPLAASAWEP